VTDVTWHDQLTEADLADVRALLLAVQAEDGEPEVSPSGGLPAEFRTGAHALARTGGLVGYAHVNTKGDAHGRQVAELFVHPEHRRAGVGTALATALVRRGGPLRVWSHRDHPGAARIAERLGFARVRELWRMRLDFESERTPRLPVPAWPAGVRLRTFVPGQDEADVIEVNRRAFDWHPEQGALTVGDLAATEDEEWFDPDGFFLAVDAEDRLLGFHWTKVHNLRPPVGEVYVVGVDPDAQGLGLGRALTIAGLHDLHRRGLSEVILYVESDNKPALAVYQKLGFTLAVANVQYDLGHAEPA
jgi:mycothiol synthase